MGYLKIFPIRIADLISYMHSIITTNPNEGCLSSLGSISKNSQNHRNIYFVETFSCSRLHAKSKKSKCRIILKNISYPHRRYDFLYAFYHHDESQRKLS